jgi:2-oxoglutarate/2-oxoacid ferredoxin oxidoreductase subunit alpha
MDEISVVICGEAGQGIQTIENALSHIIKAANYHIFATKEYMSRVRGGLNSTTIRISSHKVAALVNRIDILIPLTPEATSHLKNRITDDTIIISEQINLAKLAAEIGGKIYEGSIAVGLILGLLKIPNIIYEKYYAEIFKEKSEEIAEKNVSAVKRGYDLSANLLKNSQLGINFQSDPALKNEAIFNGAEAMALGAIAGGCNFISSYPMSPSTGVLTQLAAYSHEFGILVEQAEDEICAINMTLGAWYAGARGMVTTSGGGFALMNEGLSLAGITETPIVINLGMRPGPATGLPTRTEQGDLGFAINAGHGEFPRIIFAPGSLDQLFYHTQRAFYLAAKFQIPVILLTDQFLLDSFYNNQPMNPLLQANNDNSISKTEKNYQRYQLTANGISPRGIPGFGEGLVCVDSDEHTEAGYITEDFDLRNKMVQKRLKKFEDMIAEAITPELFGINNYKFLLVTWGSNYHNIQEALKIINRTDIALLHFSQVYPLPPNCLNYFKNAQKIFVLENNAAGQFAKLLKQELGIKIDGTILKYNGLPFAVEEIISALKEQGI